MHVDLTCTEDMLSFLSMLHHAQAHAGQCPWLHLFVNDCNKVRSA